MLLFLVVPLAARANLTGSWRVGFTDVPGGAGQDFCRFDLVEAADGQVQGYLGICGLGTDGLLSGTVDASGALTLHIVAPDDAACEVYTIAGTVTPAAVRIDAAYSCAYPLALSGYLVATPCDPLTPGSCPELSGLSLPKRLHEVRACTPEPASSCHGSTAGKAKLTIERSDTFHYAFNFGVPDATGITLADLGNPTTVRDYAVCVYHTVGGTPVLVAMEPAWAATTCGTKPCWTVQATGVKYRNTTGRRGKLSQLQVKLKRSGVANAAAKGRVTTVLPPPVGVQLGLPIVVQFLADDTCVAATFTTGTVNADGRLTAKGGQ